MNMITRHSSIFAALILCHGASACRSTHGAPEGETVLRSEHLVVRSLPPRLESEDKQVLPLLHIGCEAGDRLLALEVIIWDDVNGDRQRAPAEASERWALEGDGARAEFIEWRGLQLPPGAALRAELIAVLEQYGPFEGTWRVSPPRSQPDASR